jgi:hypothetical protein
MTLLDIPFHGEAVPQQFSRPKNLHLADLKNVQALKMTHFNQGQLCQLCAHFGLAALAEGMGTKIAIFTGHTYYQIHPEEVFLFTMTKLASGLSNHMIVNTYFGGDYNRWSYGYPWMLCYLDMGIGILSGIRACCALSRTSLDSTRQLRSTCSAIPA